MWFDDLLDEMTPEEFSDAVDASDTLTDLAYLSGYNSDSKPGGEIYKVLRKRAQKEGLDMSRFSKSRSHYYTIPEAAEDKKCGESTLYRYTENGKLPYKWEKVNGKLMKVVKKVDVRSLNIPKFAGKRYVPKKKKLPVPPNPFNSSEESLSNKESRVVAEIKQAEENLNKLLDRLQKIREVKTY